MKASQEGQEEKWDATVQQIHISIVIVYFQFERFYAKATRWRGSEGCDVSTAFNEENDGQLRT
jgi:hypothetical protein